MATQAITPTEVMVRLHHQLHVVGRAGVAFTTRGPSVTIWLFDGQMGAKFQDIKVGVVRDQEWITDEECKTFRGRGWRANLCVEIDSEIQKIMDRTGVKL